MRTGKAAMSGPGNDRLVPLGVFVALLAVFVPFARFRLVDGDEGYLLLEPHP